MKHSTVAIWLLLAAIALAGCSGKDPMTPHSTANAFAIVPSDNQTDVPRTANITMTFGKPVDKSIVETNFRLISAKALVDSLCPTPGIHHGTMETAMHDAALMAHLDSLHGIPGSFMWSSDGLVATFTPDTVLGHHTQHMVHIPQTMKTMIEQRVGDVGTAGQDGMHMPDMKFHFTTGM